MAMYNLTVQQSVSMGAKICYPSPEKLDNELGMRVQEFIPNQSISIPQNSSPLDEIDDFEDDYDDGERGNAELNLPQYDYQLIFNKLDLFPSTAHLSYKDIMEKHLVRIQAWDSPPSARMIDSKRVLAEIKILGKTLPMESSNSIFVVVNENNMAQMQAIIFGSEGTPYDSGAFLYTINLSETYPNDSPKVNLETTGNQRIRFNPNLYETGYVCLSLLGTWTGEPQENWQPGSSNISQILLSIQTIVMNEDVFYNEPSYQDLDRLEYRPYNIAYQNIVRFGNIAYAMNEMLQKPSPLFSKIIKTHFYLKRNKILETVYGWIQDKSVAIYGDLVEEQNYDFCARYSREWVYRNDLIRQLQRLYTNLSNIRIEDTLIETEEVPTKQNKVQVQTVPSHEQQKKEEDREQL